MAELMFFMRVLVLYESPLRRPPTGNSTERPAIREREREGAVVREKNGLAAMESALALL